MSLFLSRLTLNARHNRTRSEFDRPYELHRTLCRAWKDPNPARILFRSDADGSRLATVIVQSLTEPDWSGLHAPNDYLHSVDGPKQVNLQLLKHGQHLQFRLRCRPSKRIGASGAEDFGKRKSLESKGEIMKWLTRKGEAGGFEIRQMSFDRVYWHDSRGGIQDNPLGAVVFDGLLTVTNVDAVRMTVANGIGPGKAFGFGLLSLAPP